MAQETAPDVSSERGRIMKPRRWIPSSTPVPPLKKRWRDG